MDRRSDTILICVRLDRCWNRHWRCLLLLAFLTLGVIFFVLLMSGNNSGPMLETNWQKHWSQTQDSAPGSKQVFQPAGNAVNVKNEFVDEYVAQERDPEPDEGEYYDRDNPDVELKVADYMQQYHNDEIMGKKDTVKPGSMGVVPDIRDYSLRENFRHLFSSNLEVDIQFEENYINPCWPEPIPKLPYQNNSYLKVKEQAAILEPQFQYMRQLFAKRSDPSNHWRLRCLPYFYIMETPPMATPRLYKALQYHPLIVNPDMAEPEFWNQRGPEGVASLRDYLDLFDTASEKILSNASSFVKDGRTMLEHKQVTGDGTSSYLWAVDRWRNLPGNLGELEPKTTVPAIIKKLTPNAKIVMVLRNPTERLFLGYLSQTENPSASDFHSKTGQALNSMTSCEEKRSIRPCVYDSFFNKRLPVRLRIGMYYPFVQDWINVFGKDQVKVIRYEDYVSNPSEVINEVCSFLQLPPYPSRDLESMEMRIKDTERKHKSNQKLKMLSATRAMLKAFHKKLNQQLANLLQDEKFTWPELAVDPDLTKEQLAPTEAQQKELDEKQRQERENLAREQQERDRLAREQQEKDRVAREQQERDRVAREQQERDRVAREQQERDRVAREQQERDRVAREQQEKDRVAREQQEKDRIANGQQEKDRVAREQQEKDRVAREQQEKDRIANRQQEKDRVAREQQEKDRIAREQQERDRVAREQQERDRVAKEQQTREQQTREQQLKQELEKAQMQREQQQKELQQREQQQRQLQLNQQNQANQQLQQLGQQNQQQLGQNQKQVHEEQRLQFHAQQNQQQQQQNQQQGQPVQQRAP